MTSADLFAEYERLTSILPSLGDGPGRLATLGWDLEYTAPDTLIAFLDQIAFRRMTDFVADRSDPLILDCGANVGYTALHFKRLFPAARVIAFEPDPVFSAIARRNLLRNGAADVTLVEAAVWTADGRARWAMEPKDGSHLAAADTRTNTVEVATTDLRRHLHAQVDLLKVDIEGAEFDVIPHIAPSLGVVRNVLIECHLTDQARYLRLARLLEVLVDAGFNISLNSYGPWRDLVRRHTPPPLHSEQYLLVTGWRTESPDVSTEPTFEPYVGLAAAAERDRLLRQVHWFTATEHARQEHNRLIADFILRADAYELHVVSRPLAREHGNAWWWNVPGGSRNGDSPAAHSARTLLLEDDRVLGPPHSLHEDIRVTGNGRYSHWGSRLYFSTSDNSDPNTNGRTYRVLCPR
jgi:FkbM family methyltransferase